MNLDSLEVLGSQDFPMGLEDGLGPLNSLHIMNNGVGIKNINDKIMDSHNDVDFPMEIDMEENYHFHL